MKTDKRFETSLTWLAASALAISIGFSLVFSVTSYSQYNYLYSQQSTISNALTQESTAVSNLVNQESSFSSLLQQQNTVVNSLQQSVTNLNAALPSIHKGTYVNLTSMEVNYAGTSTAMLVSNVTGSASIQVYAGECNIPLSFYFAQKLGGPYYNVDCPVTTPDVCNAGSANTIVGVPPMGNFIGITGITGTAQLFVAN